MVLYGRALIVGPLAHTFPNVHFRTTADHFAAETRLFRLCVDRLVRVRRAEGRSLDRVTADVAERTRWLLDGGTGARTDAELDREVAEVEAHIDARWRASGGSLFGDRLRRSFGLSMVEWRILVALAVLEFDDSAARALVGLSADPTDSDASAGLVLDLVDPVRGRRSAVLAADAKLLRSGLVEASRQSTEDGLSEPRFSRRAVKIPASIARRIRGEEGLLDPRLDRVARFGRAGRTFGDLILDADVRARLARLRELLEAAPASTTLFLGETGTGRRTMAEALSVELGLETLHLDLKGRPDAAALLCVAVTEAACERAAVVARVDSAIGDDWDLWGMIGQVLAAAGLPLFLVSTSHVGRPATGAVHREFVVPPNSPGARERLWAKLLPEGVSGGAVKPPELAARWELTFRDITEAVLRARATAQLAGGADRLTDDDVRAAAERCVQSRMGGLGHRVPGGLGWSDFVADDETTELLREIVGYARHADMVMEDWGFRRKVPYGGGLVAMFSGPPGTGKTMAASLIAQDLGRDLYTVDLSKIVDKYIGETEKNLARIFDVAEETNVVLLFDEADALFGSRSQAKSATDRYANLEVNYLLQRVEAYRGLVLLTTNFPSGIDKAFQRRLRFHVQFREPDLATRASLWRTCIPPECRTEPGIEWQKLAERFPLNGSGIKNAVIRAAVRAAGRGVPLGQADLAHAAVRECQQLGLAVRQSES